MMILGFQYLTIRLTDQALPAMPKSSRQKYNAKRKLAKPSRRNSRSWNVLGWHPVQSQQEMHPNPPKQGTSGHHSLPFHPKKFARRKEENGKPNSMPCPSLLAWKQLHPLYNVMIQCLCMRRRKREMPIMSTYHQRKVSSKSVRRTILLLLAPNASSHSLVSPCQKSQAVEILTTAAITTGIGSPRTLIWTMGVFGVSTMTTILTFKLPPHQKCRIQNQEYPK
mmetsp:Transcript_8308/g.20001  ORF Transcript_8308/g.20001 Transcript_8308/m.20001 type:complete len:223 (+) Transcript_8308:664-1332(+)